MNDAPIIAQPNARTSLDPAAPWPFDPVPLETDAQWLENAPEAPY